MKKLKVLDLFSGIGGLSLGLERAGMETVAFCESDKHCQKVLKKHWPKIPIHDDICFLETIYDRNKYDDSYVLDSKVDIICGGFPCQNISVGGKQDGISGDRSSLWKEYWRLINEIKPKYAIIENVERLRKNGLGVVLNDLSKIGYDAEWHCITARDVGLPHQRDRLFIIANNSSKRQDECSGKKRQIQVNEKWESEKIHTKREGCEFEPGKVRTILSRGDIESIRDAYSSDFSVVSKLRRVTNGVPEKLDESRRKQRIKQLGNSVVPQIAELIGKAILEYEKSI